MTKKVIDKSYSTELLEYLFKIESWIYFIKRCLERKMLPLLELLSLSKLKLRFYPHKNTKYCDLSKGHSIMRKSLFSNPVRIWDNTSHLISTILCRSLSYCRIIRIQCNFSSNGTNGIDLLARESPQSVDNKNSDDWQLKSVSTSTSGLSDFIVSTKFRVINDTIKRFEQTFNKQNSISQTSLNFLSSSPSTYFNYNLPMNGVAETTTIAAYTSNLKSLKQQSQQKLVNFKSRLSNHSSMSNGYCTNETTTNSNSNNNNNVKSLNRSSAIQGDQTRKTISNCIDIDGLTFVNDNCFKRIIERDLDYKNEITLLKSQVQKCKLFLNSLSSNALWNEINNDFSIELVWFYLLNRFYVTMRAPNSALGNQFKWEQLNFNKPDFFDKFKIYLWASDQSTFCREIRDFLKITDLS